MTATSSKTSALILALGIALGLSTLGYLLGKAAIEYKQFERSVRVKGLAQQEFPADVVIWPIQFSVPAKSLDETYQSIDRNVAMIRQFLISSGIEESEISLGSPMITDKKLQDYGGGNQPEFRFTTIQTVTVYSKSIDVVNAAMNKLSALGKQGILFTRSYDGSVEYLFTRLNDVKPQMIEEATRNAREVAEKFAADSDSKLGKIKKASQGTFSIFARDKNNPHIKKVRVVSTVEYYLSD